MKEKLFEIGLYFITDSNLTRKTVLDDVRAAIRGGVKVIQYREKNRSTKGMVLEAKKIKKICDENNVLFLINDNIDICLAIDADGVHLGQDDMPYDVTRKLLGNKVIGVTAHNVSEAREAEKNGADYVGVSPIFHTDTKKDAGAPAGLRLISDVKESVKIPFIAIGGINQENLDSVLKAGAKSVVMISAIVCKDDVEMEVRNVIERIKNDTAS